ncbi:MAG: hypothetical protein LBT00_13295 [Spirochaetaceae bacterium]|jgi:predicted subunit of tRNA(5-methylaminomethyl-2-thiouridylate) methyltransferase|nr:hypothetical protein [Spirochaetaceae bacterium]
MSETFITVIQVISSFATPLCGWTLYTVHRLTNEMSGITARSDEAQKRIDYELVDLRARVIGCETKLTELSIEVARNVAKIEISAGK